MHINDIDSINLTQAQVARPIQDKINVFHKNTGFSTVVNKMIEPPMSSEMKLFLLPVHFNNFNNNFVVHIGIKIE